MPDGIYFKPDNTDIGISRDRAAQLPYMVRVTNPLVVADRNSLMGWLIKDRQWHELGKKVHRLEDSVSSAMDKLGLGHERFDKLGDDFTRIQIRLATAARARATELIKGAGHDGLIMKRDQGGTFNNKYVQTIVVFDTSQIKRVRFIW